MTAGQVALLTKLKIRPFSYGLKIAEIFDDGTFFSPKVLDIDEVRMKPFRTPDALSLRCPSPLVAPRLPPYLTLWRTPLRHAGNHRGPENYSFDKADEYKAAS